MKEETKNWLDMVEYDLTTAKQMLKTGRFVYVIFMCHLAIEKALKAIVCEQTNKVPPKTHDLIYLIRSAAHKPRLLRRGIYGCRSVSTLSANSGFQPGESRMG